MTKKETILISSTQYPYYGGSATNAYALIKEFRKLGYRTAGLFIDNNISKIDPDNIGGIFGTQNNSDAKIVKKKIDTYLSSEPDFVFAKNYVAPVVCKGIWKKSIVTYLVAGCPHMMELSKKNISAIKYLSEIQPIDFEPEKRCISNVDYIIPNSFIGKKLLHKHYGSNKKILNSINTSLIINNLSKSSTFNDRQIDLIFISSNMKREVKNASFAVEIYKKLPQYNKCVVGANSSIFNGIKNTKIYQSLDNKFVLNLLSNSKLIICPSLYDASPNIIREAISCGSNILISKNCGWSETFGEHSVCKDVYDINEWLYKIKMLMKDKIDYEQNVRLSIIEQLMMAVK